MGMLDRTIISSRLVAKDYGRNYCLAYLVSLKWSPEQNTMLSGMRRSSKRKGGDSHVRTR
jgi:hypothetical protein